MRKRGLILEERENPFNSKHNQAYRLYYITTCLWQGGLTLEARGAATISDIQVIYLF
jgi:hypothetical protein